MWHCVCVCVHVLHKYIISQQCINILVSKLIRVHLHWIYLLKKKNCRQTEHLLLWKMAGRTLSLRHDKLEFLHLFAFVHTSVMKCPRFDFFVVVVNVTHICVDLQIHLWSISADQNWLMAFLGGTYMSRHGPWGLWQSWFMEFRGISLTTDPTGGQLVFTPRLHICHNIDSVVMF